MKMKDSKRDLAKWAKQRSERGFSDQDLWGFDVHLARVVHDGLVKFVENGVHGVPNEVVERTWKNDVDAAAVTWEAILRRIIIGFNEYLVYKENMDDLRWEEFGREEFERAKYLLMKYWDNLWD